MSHKENSKEKTRRNNGKRMNKIIGLLVISIALVAMLYTLEPIMAINGAVDDAPPDVVIDDPIPDVTSDPPHDTPPSDVTSGPTPPSTPTPPANPTPTSTPTTPTPTPTPTSTTPTPTPTPTPTSTTPTPTSTTPTPTSTTPTPTSTPTSTVIPKTPTPTPTSAPARSNSRISEIGNSGSLSIVSKDAPENLLKYEIVENNIVANRPIKYSFTMPEFAIYEVMINGQNNENQLSIKIEHLLNTSKYALDPAPGIIYRNENVWIGTKKINYISVKFRVKNSWFKENNLNENVVPYLSKWNGTTWLILKTNMTNKDETYTYFETPKAGASSLGVFAISVLKRTTNVNILPTSTAIEQEEIIIPEIEEIVPNKTSGFNDMMLIASMILMLAYVIKKRYD